MSGNLIPADETITLDDLLSAIEQTHTEKPLPPGIDEDTLLDLVQITAKANKEAGREMGFGGALAWGIAIGVYAERLRTGIVHGD